MLQRGTHLSKSIQGRRPGNWAKRVVIRWTRSVTISGMNGWTRRGTITGCRGDQETRASCMLGNFKRNCNGRTTRGTLSGIPPPTSPSCATSGLLEYYLDHDPFLTNGHNATKGPSPVLANGARTQTTRKADFNIKLRVCDTSNLPCFQHAVRTLVTQANRQRCV